MRIDINPINGLTRYIDTEEYVLYIDSKNKLINVLLFIKFDNKSVVQNFNLIIDRTTIVNEQGQMQHKYLLPSGGKYYWNGTTYVYDTEPLKETDGSYVIDPDWESGITEYDYFINFVIPNIPFSTFIQSILPTYINLYNQQNRFNYGS